MTITPNTPTADALLNTAPIDIQLLELARRHLVRAIARLAATMDDESATPETRRKAASGLIRLYERFERRRELAAPPTRLPPTIEPRRPQPQTPAPSRAPHPQASPLETKAEACALDQRDHSPTSPPPNRRQRRAAARILANETKRAARRDLIDAG